MADKSEQPRLTKLIIGTAAGILLTICIGVSIASGAVVSIPLRIILFIPDQLGLVWRVTPEDTLRFFALGTYRLPQFPKGRYLVYIMISSSLWP